MNIPAGARDLSHRVRGLRRAARPRRPQWVGGSRGPDRREAVLGRAPLRLRPGSATLAAVNPRHRGPRRRAVEGAAAQAGVGCPRGVTLCVSYATRIRAGCAGTDNRPSGPGSCARPLRVAPPFNHAQGRGPRVRAALTGSRDAPARRLPRRLSDQPSWRP